MPRRRQIEPFLLVITDRDRGLFNVIGPMIDDTAWNDRVCEAQRQGRQVNCDVPRQNSKETVIALMKRQLGLEYTDEQLV